MRQDPGRLIAIGDVHGCVHALDALLEAISPDLDDTLVFLGDVIDQGRNSKEVVDRIIELELYSSVVLVQGNHEEMLLAARGSERALRYWEYCGGGPTINSYRFGGSLKDIPSDHWDRLEESVPFYETDDYIFAHANYQPNLPMSAQPEYQLRWALFEPAKMQAHISGKPIVVGHTEQADGEILDLGYALCIDTGCWRGGWLTAIDMTKKETWQASRWGIVREPEEPSHRSHLRSHWSALRKEALAAT
jgi:serine/threonine protein phosphatase 1